MSDVKVISHRQEVMDALQAAIDRALETCGGKAESYAKKLCPVDTGHLRDSISHKQEDDTTELIGTVVEYAPYVELGFRHYISGKHINGRPYLRPALEDHISEYKQIIERELGKIG